MPEDTEEERELKSKARATIDDDTTLAREIKLFSVENPPDAKYVRKKLINWVEFKRRHGVRKSDILVNPTQPMTQARHSIWATREQGMSEEDAKQQWKQLHDDP